MDEPAIYPMEQITDWTSVGKMKNRFANDCAHILHAHNYFYCNFAHAKYSYL